MRSPILCGFLLLILASAAYSKDKDKNDPPSKATEAAGSASADPSAAPAAEVTIVKNDIEQLRHQLAEQQKNIERLQALIEQLAAKAGTAENASLTKAAPETPAAPTVITFPSRTGDGEDVVSMVVQPTEAKKDAPLPTSGWNGEHFFLRSPDGNFTLLPIGYVNTQYASYWGDGAPPNTFSIRRARFGVQGTYGAKVDYAFLFESANTSSGGIAVRDMYANFKPTPAFQIQAGQFKEPFSQEVGTGDTNVEFLERSIVSVLYPSAGGTFRAPGIAAHGDIAGGVIQYWAGIFNGKGLLATNTTNELETVEKLRLSPWRRNKEGFLKGLIIGGSHSHGRSRGLSNELSFSGVLTDNAYTFFPQFRINGDIERYNGEILWLSGPLGVRGEYTQILQKRDGIGSETPGGIAFQTLPGVVGKGAYGIVTYLLTGEREPENAIPRVKHPVIGPPTPGVDGGSPGWGAWQVKFRYAWLEGKAGGQNFPSQFTPASVPTFSDHTDQFSVGLNWYLNYWVLVKLDLNVDRLRNPSVQGILPQNYFVALQGLQFRF